jgi:hypothetical protein
MDEHDQYPTLRELAEGAEDVIEVPAVIVRELFAERDALVAERDHERGLRQGLDRLANTLFEERDGARAERDRLRARLHELMARDVDVVDLMNVEYGCPDCGVHHACGEIVAERDRLRAAVARYKEFAESEILDHVSAELGVDLRRQLDGSGEATNG